MSARSMALDVLVRLKDQLSGPLRGLRNQLQRITEFSKKIGLIGTAIATISFMAPIQEAAAFQQKLVDIAATANYSGEAAFKFVDQAKGKYEDLALKIGQYSDTIAEGAGQMIAAGLDEKLVDQSIGSIGRAATAAHAQFSDMASVATSMMQTLKVPANQLDDSMAALVVSGKQGAFELRDMAKYFPTLTGQMAKLGVTGREAINFLGASLQIARKGTSDPAEAANNLKNFLSKILAPVTIKNFKDAGVDIEAVMKDAATKGINPIEAVVQKISKLTGASGKEIDGLMKKAKANGMEGAEALGYVREQLVKLHGAGKLGDLFSDMQVMDFLIPMLGNIDDYKQIKEEVAKATGGMIDTDFNTQMQALNQQLTIFKEIGTQGTREVGLAFGTWLPMINEGLMAALKWLRELDTATGGWVKQGLALAGVGVLAAAAFGALGIALPIIGAGLSAIASLIGVLLSPIGLLVGALAGGAYLAWKNWDTVAPYLNDAWTTIKDSAAAAWEGIKAAWQEATPYLEAAWEGLKKVGAQLWDGIRTVAGQAWTKIKSTWATVQPYFARIWNSMKRGGTQAWEALIDVAPRLWSRLKSGYAAISTEAIGYLRVSLENVQRLFKGFMKGLDFKLDLSGLTIDDAKIGALRALDAALVGLKAAYEAMKDFATGLQPYMEGIGENLGATIKDLIRVNDAVGRVAAAFGRLISALGQLVNVDTSSVTGVFKTLGDLVGGSIMVATLIIRKLADGLAAVAEAIANLAEGKKVDWSTLVPTGVADAWATVSQKFADFLSAARALPGELAQIGIDAGNRMVQGIKDAIDGLVEWFKALPARILGAIGKINLSGAFNFPGGFSLSSWSSSGNTPANDNSVEGAVEKLKDAGKVTPPGRQPASDDGREKSLDDFLNGPPAIPGKQTMAPAQGPVKGEVVVKSEVKVAVDGPGRVVSQTPQAPVAVPVNTNTGRAIGRV
ncbi:phage tail tape measure protein [Rhizobium sp. P38BS-XIX]|uniref:phage tail tape measure protein n=1 Tax=Rhizobium sp. P38BS-XIX TaxID=2726740 RepID=UPI001456CA4D|nr:phage tail tape measure protein [Rhizobium sp. P38BS-XIX]NLS00178.1 phage tail tape measure protein [Rhizobium sp. P38BS-XIX]